MFCFKLLLSFLPLVVYGAPSIPSIVTVNPPQLNAGTNQDHSLTCIVERTGLVHRLYWTKNLGKPLVSSPKFYLSSVSEIDNHWEFVLIIRNAQQSDSGDYTCHVTETGESQTVSASFGPEKDCGKGFRCVRSGKCVSREVVCNGESDCNDGSDEQSCEKRKSKCHDNEFECTTDKRCIPALWRCDGQNDCKDGSDEKCPTVTCDPQHRMCRNSSQCIPLRWFCDGDTDCHDGTDELEELCFQLECPIGHQHCRTQEENKYRCIPNEWFCDGEVDCFDSEDELNCNGQIERNTTPIPASCQKDEFRCIVDGRCIPMSAKCNNIPDCVGATDEIRCNLQPLTCGADQFKCTTGECIPKQLTCNHVSDCSNGKDEEGCFCSEKEFTCISSGLCIPHMWLCDNERDCIDGSDEKPEICQLLRNTECTEDQHFQCASGSCIAKHWRCDEVKDCPDASDEKNCEPHPCTVNNGGCQQQCDQVTPTTHRCTCFSGYRFNEATKTCQDIDECAENPSPCMHTCTNLEATYRCSCPPDYNLAVDGRTCIHNSQRMPVLVVANRRSIMKFDTGTRSLTTLVSGTNGAISVEVDLYQHVLYYTDVTVEKIIRVPLTSDENFQKKGRSSTTVLNSGVMTPDGIAIDWVHHHVYWTDTGTNTLEVASMDGTIRKILFRDLDEPRAIVLDPSNGNMYWSDWGMIPSIQKSGMDGSERRSIITQDIHWPNGLTIDYASHKIFWADAKLGRISCSGLEGENVRVILEGEEFLPHPFGLAVFDDTLYWTDWDKQAILSVNKNTGENFQQLYRGLQSPMGIIVAERDRMFRNRSSNVCGVMNGGCSHLCLPTSRSSDSTAPLFACACPNEYTLSDDGKTCVSATNTMIDGESATQFTIKGLTKDLLKSQSNQSNSFRMVCYTSENSVTCVPEYSSESMYIDVLMTTHTCQAQYSFGG